MIRQGRLLKVGRLLAAVTGLPARRRSAAERLVVTGLELELVEAVHRLAEVPARCHEAEAEGLLVEVVSSIFAISESGESGSWHRALL